jgi:methionyl-tRNA synthetase
MNKNAKKVLIGLSWVYANGRLHIGHVGSSLPADALARFHRLIGNDVSFITGSDCYGTPILVESLKEGVEPADIAEKYHKMLDADFARLGFSFDNYTKTMSAHHNKFAMDFHAAMYGGAYVYEKAANQLYCEKCEKYLPDRYVEGICPHCGKAAKGDSCDHCGKILEPEDLRDPKCKLCGATPVLRKTSQLYLKLSALQGELQAHYDAKKDGWTVNAQGLTGRYLNEGLVDRAITRNISWGIPVPYGQKTKDGAGDWADKRIYIWAENVLGYLSATKEYCEKSGRDWKEFLLDDDDSPRSSSGGKKPLHYYVHAKDNIPFHTLILPGLMLANPAYRYHKPDVIVASEYITLEGKKMSKSAGTLLTAHEMSDAFDADLIRYYFLRNMNDRKDVNFAFTDFVNVVNGELVNNFGNLVNRTLSFVKSKLGGEVTVNDNWTLNSEVTKAIEDTYREVSEFMVAGQTGKALQAAFGLVNFGNKYFDVCKPWETVKKDDAHGIELCRKNILEVATIIANAVKICEPFVPFACAKVQSWLGVPRDKFEPFVFEKSFMLPEIEILYKRLDIKEVNEKFAKYL